MRLQSNRLNPGLQENHSLQQECEQSIRSFQNNKEKIKSQEKQTYSQKYNLKCRFIMSNYYRFSNNINQIKLNPRLLQKTQHMRLSKALSIKLSKNYFQYLKVQSLVFNTRKSSIYYTYNTVRLAIISFQLIVCFQLIIYAEASNLSKFTVGKLQNYLESLIQKYDSIKTRIESFRQTSVSMFQDYFKGKSCQQFLSFQEIKYVYDYLQQNTCSYLLLVQKIQANIGYQQSTIEKALIAQLKQV